MLVPHTTEPVEASELAIGDFVEIEDDEYVVTEIAVSPDAVDIGLAPTRHDMPYQLTCAPTDLITRITSHAEIAERMPGTDM